MAALGLLPYLALALLFCSVPGESNRERFLYASVLWGILVLILTETMSFIGAIAPMPLRVAWAIVCVSALVVALRRGRLPARPHLALLGWITCGLVLIPLMAGLVYPPVTWDALTYHLPKVEHWLQNANVGHYPTSNPRQNILAPCAEYVLLQLRALSGGDLFANSVQWLAYAGSVLNVSLIAGFLGANRHIQQFAALLCASIPMAVLQASTCQTDMFTAWQLSSMVALGLLWHRKQCRASGILFGGALGLACFAKGTAYPIALPFVLLYAVYTFLRPRKRLATALCAALLALLCNMPFFLRNIADYGDPLGRTQATVAGVRLSPSVRNTLANIVCNLAVNIELPRKIYGEHLHDEITGCVEFVLDKLAIKKDSKKFFPFSNFSERFYFVIHEDAVQNLFSVILVGITFFYLLLRGQPAIKIYIACVSASFIIFCATIAWQPWITRLQLPIFVLAMPAVGMAFSGKKRLLEFTAGLCVLSALFCNIFSVSHPFLKKDFSLPPLSAPREEQYFFPYSDLDMSNFQMAADAACSHKKLGLIVGGDSRYYMLFPMLRARGCAPEIFHIMTEADRDKAESVFLMDEKCRFGICRPADQNPFVPQKP